MGVWGQGSILPPLMCVGAPLWCVTPMWGHEAMWGREGGTGSGLTFSGWPHAHPSKEPFRHGNACQALRNGKLIAIKEVAPGTSRGED